MKNETPARKQKVFNFFKKGMKLHKHPPVWLKSIYCDLPTSFMGKTVKRAQLFKGWIWEPKKEAN